MLFKSRELNVLRNVNDLCYATQALIGNDEGALKLRAEKNTRILARIAGKEWITSKELEVLVALSSESKVVILILLFLLESWISIFFVLELQMLLRWAESKWEC